MHSWHIVAMITAGVCVACDPPPPKSPRLIPDGGSDTDGPLPSPDQGPIDPPDTTPPPPDGGPRDRGVPPPDAADAEVDAGPAGSRPAPDRIVVLSGRLDLWVAWIAGGRLWARRLEHGAEAPGPLIDGGEVPAPDGPLVGARTQSGRPWVFLPAGEDGEVVARDVAQGTEVPLGLYGPVLASPAGSEVLVVGRSGAEPDAAVAWRVLDGERIDVAHTDTTGIPMPIHVAPGLANWVFGFEGGHCAALGTDYRLEEAWWRCGARRDAGLVGLGERLVFVAVEGDRLVAWRATPGAAARPEGVRVDDPPEGPVGEVELVTGVVEAGPPLSPVGRAVALPLRDGEGDAVWLVAADDARRVPVEAADRLLGVGAVNRSVYRIEWDEAAGVVTRPATATDGPADPPVFERPDPACRVPQVLPEDCAEVDRDCTGEPAQGLCCGDPTPDTLAGVDVGARPEGDLAITKDVGTYYFVVRSAQEAVLLSHPTGDTSGRAAGVLARWPGVAEVQSVSVAGARALVVARATPDEGEGDRWQALWLLEPGRTSRGATPCAPVRWARLSPDGSRARFFCLESARDVAAGDDAFSEVAYPGGVDDVRWMVPAAMGRDDLLLAAVGDDHDLRLWVDGPEGIEAAADASIPEVVAALPPAARTAPIYLPVVDGGRVARIREDAWLEVLDAAGIWRPAPSSAWPRRAFVVAHRPLAVTLARLNAPEEGGVGDGLLAFFAHDLSPGGDWWGRPAPVREGRFTPENIFRAFAVADFPVEPEEPVIFRLSGANEYRLDALRIGCGSAP